MLRVLFLLFVAVTASPVLGQMCALHKAVSLPGTYPAAGVLLSVDAEAAKRGAFQCSGTLIAPRAFLTAAHCVVDPSGYAMQASYFHVFFQTAGIYDVKQIFLPDHYWDYWYFIRDDIAVLELDRPVIGVRPMQINTKGTPEIGTAGVTVGFGGVGTVEDCDTGFTHVLKLAIKRQGKDQVLTSDCPRHAPDQGWFVCYGGPSASPLQPEVCHGDSGGGLYSVDATPTVMGITSTASSPHGEGCTCPKYQVDTDVFSYKAWIEDKLATIGAGRSLESEVCGDFACLMVNDIRYEFDYLIHDTPKQIRSTFFYVPEGSRKVIITMNGEANDDESLAGTAHFDLFIRSCGPYYRRVGQFVSCEYDNLPPGPFPVSVGAVQGSGLFQVTATALRGPWPQEEVSATHKWRRPRFSSQTR